MICCDLLGCAFGLCRFLCGLPLWLLHHTPPHKHHTPIHATGGLAAPIVAGALVAPLLTAAGAGALGASFAAFVGTTAGTALVMTSLGAAGAGYAGTRVLRRLGTAAQ